MLHLPAGAFTTTMVAYLPMMVSHCIRSVTLENPFGPADDIGCGVIYHTSVDGTIFHNRDGVLQGRWQVDKLNSTLIHAQ